MPKPEGLFAISEIAAVCGVSVNALRFYEEKGLLMPAYVSAGSGYRFYSRENLLRLRTVLGLKEAGLSLKEIKAYLDGAADAAEKLTELKRRRELLDRAIEDLEARSTPPGALEVREIVLPARLCLCRTVRARDAEDALMQISFFYAELIRCGAPMSKTWPEFCEYPDMGLLAGDFPLTDFTVKACVPVEEKNAPPEAELYAAGDALSVHFRGSYFELYKAYAALNAYCGAHGIAPAGYPQEIYLEIEADGSMHLGSEAYVTRLILPAKKQ